MNSAQQTTRYPGIRAFERAERGQFFGRQRETAAAIQPGKGQTLNGHLRQIRYW